MTVQLLRKEDKAERTHMMAQTSLPPKTGINFIFMKKQSTYKSNVPIKNTFLQKDTKVKHFCREPTAISLLHSVQNELLKFSSIAATRFQEFQFLQQTNTVITYFLYFHYS